MSGYSIAAESLPDIYSELEPLFREHYAEMTARLLAQGVAVSPYNPRLDQYFEASRGGWLRTFVMRLDGKPIGYALVYITSDMHNRDLIAQEDTLFVTRAHRNGAGKKLVQFGLKDLAASGIRRLSVTALTDVRVAKLWRRMGFKEVATQMVYDFGGQHVRA